MSWGDVTAAVVGFFGGGAAWKALGKYLDGRKAKAKAEAEQARAEASIASKALDIVRDEREDTQQTTDKLFACERRCANIETRMARLEAELEAEREFRKAVQGDHANALQMVELLQTQVEALMGEVTMLREAIAMQRPGDRTEADTDPPPASKLRVVEQNTAPQKGKR